MNIATTREVDLANLRNIKPEDAADKKVDQTAEYIKRIVMGVRVE